MFTPSTEDDADGGPPLPGAVDVIGDHGHQKCQQVELFSDFQILLYRKSLCIVLLGFGSGCAGRGGRGRCGGCRNCTGLLSGCYLDGAATRWLSARAIGNRRCGARAESSFA